MVTVARLGLYFVHMALAPLLMAIQEDQAHPHFLSDHIFLGAPTGLAAVTPTELSSEYRQTAREACQRTGHC